MDKIKKAIISSYSTVDVCVCAAISIVVMWFNVIAGVVCLLVTALLWTYHKYVTEKKISKKLVSYKASVVSERNDMMQAFADGAPLLICTLDKAKNVRWSNDKFNEVMLNTGDWSDIKSSGMLDDIYSGMVNSKEISVGDRVFKVNSAFLKEDGSRMFFFRNETAREIISKKYRDEKPCLAIVGVDNYEEILQGTSVENRSSVAAEIDAMVYEWGKSLDGLVLRTDDNRYAVVFEYKYLEAFLSGNEAKKKEITLLDGMHSLKTEADFPASVSIGIGYGEEKLEGLLDSSLEAIELALGRGGDQVVIRQKGGETRYIGGNLPEVEKKKGNVKVLAHALYNHINDADRVLIAGHARPDMDSLGAALGIYAFVISAEKEVHIVLEESSDGIADLFEAARGYEYSFISGEQAVEMLDKKTLVIMVDHSKASISECPELIEKAGRIAVIDHHRIDEEAVDPIFKHIQSFSSSASEMVAEILQVSGERGQINRFEANAMLAGIVLDTKNFTTNTTGARTFEAASWLRQHGGDMNVVKNYFKIDLDFYQKRVNIIANAQVVGEGIVVAYTKDVDPAMGIIVSQAADELLKMKGISCAVTAGRTPAQTMVSARSEGKTYNVQTLMEKLGGGGHQNAAAVQLDVGAEEAISQVVQAMRLEGMI